MRAAIAEAGLPEVATIVYTHHHWDHVWGACAWEVDDIVGHAAGAPILSEEAARPWSAWYAEQVVRDNPRLSVSFAARTRAVPDWSDLEVLPPTRTFDAELELADGLVIRHIGGKHAPDSSIMVDLGSRVALLGDCFYPPPLHLRDPGDSIDEVMVAGLKRISVDWLVEAHRGAVAAAVRRWVSYRLRRWNGHQVTAGRRGCGAAVGELPIAAMERSPGHRWPAGLWCGGG